MLSIAAATGAERPKTPNRFAALRGGAFGESGFRSRYPVERGGSKAKQRGRYSLKTIFWIKIVPSKVVTAGSEVGTSGSEVGSASSFFTIEKKK